MKKIRSLISKKLVLVIILIIIIAGVAGGFLFYNNYQKQKNTTDTAAVEIGSITKSVGKLIDLPTGETPQLATVSDITKLKGQEFFAKAKNGDKVLVFTKAKKAIIYRPSENKIIEVAFYNPQASSSTSQEPTKGSATPSTPTPAPKQVKVAVYNSTKTAGLAKSVGSNLESKFPNIKISSTANASEDYTKNIVIDISGNNSSLVKSIAAEIKGEAGSLPSSETEPDADILVILGESQ